MSGLIPAMALYQLKQIAKEKLPRTSTLRDFLLAEPDFMSPTELKEKVSMYARLLSKELGNLGVT